MFIVKKQITESIVWPVRVYSPLDGGDSKYYEFKGTFNRPNEEQLDQIEQETQSDGSSEWIDAYVKRTMKIMTNWSGVCNEEKEPIEFTEENFRDVLRTPQCMAIINGISTAINQIRGGIKVKNL
jgi:hypothetical protein